MTQLSRLIGICGRARHGKGEVAAQLVELGFRDVQFSTSVKELLTLIDPLVDDNALTGEVIGSGDNISRLSWVVERYGLDAAKTLPDVRRMLQAVGNGAREIVHPDTWVNGFRRRHGDEIYAGAKLVVSDMRYPNEADMIFTLGGEVWKVVRPDFDNGLGELNGNASETAVDEITPDLTILNDGTLQDLRLKLKRYFVQRSLT